MEIISTLTCPVYVQNTSFELVRLSKKNIYFYSFLVFPVEHSCFSFPLHKRNNLKSNCMSTVLTFSNLKNYYKISRVTIKI